MTTIIHPKGVAIADTREALQEALYVGNHLEHRQHVYAAIKAPAWEFWLVDDALDDADDDRLICTVSLLVWGNSADALLSLLYDAYWEEMEGRDWSIEPRRVGVSDDVA